MKLFQILHHKPQVFPGNSNQNGIVKNSLQEVAIAKFIRFQPTTYRNFKGLRVEVYGIILTKGIYISFTCVGNSAPPQRQTYLFARICESKVYPLYTNKFHTLRKVLRVIVYGQE